MTSFRLIGSHTITAAMGRVGTYAFAAAAFGLAVVLALVGAGEATGALTDWQALVLGLVQGFTELLPISSSGHLILVPWLFDWTYLEEHDAFNQTFDVALHLGTLVAVAAYFWREVVDLLAALVSSIRKRRIETMNERLVWLLGIATVPAALVGALGEDFIVEHLGEPWQIAICFIVFALLLWLADRSPTTRELGDVRLRDALGVGFAQALALMPGVSRSGITITAARFLKLDRDSAARFSFLLLLPTTLGAVVFKGTKDVLLADLPPGSTGPFLVGTLAALAGGLVAIKLLLDYVRRHTYTIFVVYRLLAAVGILILIATGVRSATF
jgi:undecaprenyl-diphosphatase